MDDRELLLRASEELPVQASAASGAVRDAAEEGADGACGMSWSGWGN